MIHLAKFDAASFILGGEIRNLTNKQKTVTDISTRCLSACVDNDKRHWPPNQNAFSAIQGVSVTVWGSCSIFLVLVFTE